MRTTWVNAVIGVTLVTGLAGLTGCSQATPVTLPGCALASAPVYPGETVQVSVVDNGATICLPVGLVLGVVLSVPANRATQGWAPIVSSDSAILRFTTAVGGVPTTATMSGLFKAKKRGVATVSSYLPPCRGPALSCPIDQRWSVTVVVGGSAVGAT